MARISTILPAKLVITLSTLLLLSVVSALVGAAEQLNQQRSLSRSLEATPTVAPSEQGTYRAIVIGNNRYRDPQKVWRPLKTAVNDAAAIAKTLKSKYGFSDVELLKNVTRRQILNSLNKLRDRVKENDSVLVYYAGHGWRNDKTKEAYWIPIDVEGEDDSFYLSNVRIKEKLSVVASIASHTLLISDSCFSGTLLDYSRGKSVSYNSDNDAYFRKVAKRKSVQILAAGGKEYVDDNYRGSGHSPFTYFLLKELDTNNDKHITLANLALNVEQSVAKNSAQTPQSGALRLAGDEGGQFIFTLTSSDSGVVITVNKPSPSTTQNSSPEFGDWKKLNQNKPAELLAYITAYPNGSITDVAKIKYQSLLSKIDNLLKFAKEDIKGKRYTSPANRNAKSRYKAILKLDDKNQRAEEGLKKLAYLILSKAEDKIARRKYKDASRLLTEVETIDSSLPQIAKLRSTIRNKSNRKKPTRRAVDKSFNFTPPPSF